MKVSIVPGTKKKGLILKSEIHTIALTVQFSEEELAKIEAAGIRNYAVIENAPFHLGTPGLDLEVFFLMKGETNTFQFENQTEAQKFTNLLKASLTNLKEHLEAYGEEAEAETFEL